MGGREGGQGQRLGERHRDGRVCGFKLPRARPVRSASPPPYRRHPCRPANLAKHSVQVAAAAVARPLQSGLVLHWASTRPLQTRSGLVLHWASSRRRQLSATSRSVEGSGGSLSGLPGPAASGTGRADPGGPVTPDSDPDLRKGRQMPVVTCSELNYVKGCYTWSRVTVTLSGWPRTRSLRWTP